MARATASSLKAHRSSSEPPPRATITTSTPGCARHVANGAGDFVAAPSPWTRHGRISSRRPAWRLVTTRHDVADRRALERGHDADGARQQRQRTLARRGEQPFGLEPALQLLEGELERAEPARLEVLTDDLHLAARLVDLELAAGDDVLAVGGLEAEQPQVAAEHHRLDLRGVVLEREVEMPRGGRPGVRDLALEPDLEELLLQAARDGRGQLADRVDGPRRWLRSGRQGGLRRSRGRARARFTLRLGRLVVLEGVVEQRRHRSLPTSLHIFQPTFVQERGD